MLERQDFAAERKLSVVLFIYQLGLVQKIGLGVVTYSVTLGHASSSLRLAHVICKGGIMITPLCGVVKIK